MTIDPTSVPPFGFGVIPIEELLHDAESNARKRLIAAGIIEDDIETCLIGPVDKYYQLKQEGHRLFHDGECVNEIMILQHARNIRNWMSSVDWSGGRTMEPEEWVSHGYMLGFIQLLAAAPDRAASFKSAHQSLIAQKPRKGKRITKKGIEAVMSRADVDLWGFGMTAFREYVGYDCKVPALDGYIFISAIEGDSNKIAKYFFQYRSDDEHEVIEENSSIGAIRAAISRLKKFL